ncbi:MAG TPA: hypothetical protein VLV30_04520 [Methanomicrobiales archaeon]|nr:hypothetical protein [Methanomicrobiales archaeon]
MVTIDRVPAENRWRLATAGAMDLAMAYSAAVRETVGEAFGEALDEMEAGFWEQAGLEQLAIARAFAFPLRTAREVAEAFTTLSVLFQGPQLEVGRIQDGGDDTAVIQLESCPALLRARRSRMDPKKVCMGCRAYSRSAVEALNPAYTLTHGKSMCMGDQLCEMTVSPPRRRGRKSPQPAGKG